MEFVHQPYGQPRLGEYLSAHLADLQWTHFRAAVAFAKRSGVNQLRAGLEAFRDRGGVAVVTVGIDMFGTSREALDILRQSLTDGGLRVYHNAGSSTFHPKIYLFKNATHADVIIGSGNLTAGGLFTNYEASLAVALNLTDVQDTAFLTAVEQILNTWSEPAPNRCYVLTAEFLAQLVAANLVRTEIQIAIAQQAAAAAAATTAAANPNGPATAGTTGSGLALFSSSSVPSAPIIVSVIPAQSTQATSTSTPASPASAATPISISTNEVELDELDTPVTSVDISGISGSLIIPMQAGGFSNFVMTLQTTDVGVGQTTAGTSRRSPEVFIPLAALDSNPTFWGFPLLFVDDVQWNAANPSYRRQGVGKMDRAAVPMRIGTIASVNMFFNPRKGDFRLRHESMRSAGNVGDLMLIRLADPSNGFNYDVQVVPASAPLFAQLQTLCNQIVPHSQKQFGYF